MTSVEKHYRTLGVEPGASLKEIKQAYRDLAAVWHPDRFTNNPRLQEKAQETLKEINVAYEYLRTYSVNDQPRLMEIIILPQTVQLNLGESQDFRLLGLDQNRNPIDITDVEWSATGGTISSDGYFLAEHDGCFLVTASVEKLSHSAYITVVKPLSPDTNPILKKETSQREYKNSTQPEAVSNHKTNQNSKFNKIVSFIRLILWGFWAVLVFMPQSNKDYILAIPTSLFCFSALLIGLISPNLVLTFGLRKNRKTVILLYLPPFLIYIFFPFSYEIALVVIETSLWVVVDAKEIGVKKGQLGGGFFDRGRWEWFILCLLFWIIGFPSYLIKRAAYIKQHRVSSTERA